MRILTVDGPLEGSNIAKKVLYEKCDKKTVLFLSGGSTPSMLYKTLSIEKKLKIGAAALIDERYFNKGSSNFTNESLLKKTGLLQFFDKQNIKFFSVLEKNRTIEMTTKNYDETVRYLLNYFPKSIAIMGIGDDGHTAGIPARSQNLKVIGKKNTDFVNLFNDFPGKFKNRITLSFNSLSQIDLLIVLAFGENKKKFLRKMFKNVSLEKVPAKFYDLEQISKKTILITDQKI